MDLYENNYYNKIVNKQTVSIMIPKHVAVKMYNVLYGAIH